MSAARDLTVCVDVGSTFTKAAAVDGQGRLVAHAESPTTSTTDVLEGLDAAVAGLGVGRVRDESLLVCSSAGGGLRLAVVGQERVVSVEAGSRVALSAGARVVGVWAGRLSSGLVTSTARRDLAESRDGPILGSLGAAPALATADVVLLVGGTDGGDQEVLLHNARILGRSPLGTPIVLAGNRDAAPAALALLQRGNRVVLQAENVIPRIGELAPDSARSAIRSVFIEHVIGGKGLSRGRRFGRLVRCATPDAVLTGVEVLSALRAGSAAGDVLVVDIGGATTDVYSVLREVSSDAAGRQPAVVGVAPAGRTVEGDLGMRWSAQDLLRAALGEHLVEPLPISGAAHGPAHATSTSRRHLAEAAAQRHADVGFLPTTDQDADLELMLARLAATVAVRRHARPGAAGRDLRHVGLVIGSGGVLRHAEPDHARSVLQSVLSDRAGGWARPGTPAVTVDTDYVLAPIGLLAMSGQVGQAEALAGQLLAASDDSNA